MKNFFSAVKSIVLQKIYVKLYMKHILSQQIFLARKDEQDTWDFPIFNNLYLFAKDLLKKPTLADFPNQIWDRDM